MKKTLKSIVKALFGLVLFLLVLVLALPLWIGPVVTMVANKVVPGKIGTDFNLSEFGFNQYSGKVHVGGLTIANPEGFSKENCVDLTDLNVNVAMTTLLSDKIHVEEVVLDGLVVSTTPVASNFKKIAANAAAAGGGDDAKKASPEPEKPAEEAAPAAPAKEGKKPPKVIIDSLVLRNVTVKLGGMPIPIPEIKMKDIGAESEEGLTLEEIWVKVRDAVLSSASALGSLAADLGKGAVDAGAKIAGAAADAAKSAGGAAADAAKSVGGAAADAAKSVGGAAADAAKSVGGAAADVGGAAVDAAKDAGKAVMNLFK